MPLPYWIELSSQAFASLPDLAIVNIMVAGRCTADDVYNDDDDDDEYNDYEGTEYDEG